VILYLDSSALVKLLIEESESAALREYLQVHVDDLQMSSALARTEVVRAVPGDAASVRGAWTLLDALGFVPVHVQILDQAAVLPGVVRTLDAIHLATARFLSPQLRAVVTYDRRMAAAAEANGLPVAAPA
jgi:predicted nucleic acid-binding protein